MKCFHWLSATCARFVLRIHGSLKKKLFITGMCVAAAAGVTWLCLPARPKPETKATSSSRSREGTAVRTVVVRPEPLEETVIATGTVRAEESVELQPEIAGKLLHLHFVEGARVRAGDLLAVINDAELRASLQRAIHRRDLAELKARRITSLIDKGGVPQQEYDIAASELSVLGAEVDLIRAQLARTEIRAPFDGIIGLRSASEGSYLTTGSRIARLQAVDHVKVDLSFPEKYTGRVQVGQIVEFTVAGVAETGRAEIYALEPQIDETTRTVLARARAANPGRKFHPGAFARVVWQSGTDANALMVPALAVISGSGEKSIFVDHQGKAEQRIVATGLRTADKVQILRGLQPGESVVVSGLQNLRAGATLRPVESVR